MTELEYIVGLVILLLGFNLGYYESNKGLTLRDFKRLFQQVANKIRKHAWR